MLAPTAPAHAEALDPSSIAGEWVRAQPERDDARRHEAIQGITDELSFLIRGFAAGFMRRATRPPDRYVIRRSRDGLTIRRDDGEPTTARLDGGSDPDRDAEAVSRPIEGGFVQSWRHGDSNHGTTTWRVTDGPDGGRLLRVTVTVNDERFHHPLVYTTTYRPVAAEPPSPSSQDAPAVASGPHDGSALPRPTARDERADATAESRSARRPTPAPSRFSD